MSISKTIAGDPGSSRNGDRDDTRVYLVGGGIASLAAAAFMIRDGDVPGHNITILEESGVIGGSLDGSGNPITGYELRGGRMLESKYVCTFALFDSIPTLAGTGTVTQEIRDWNNILKTDSKSRLFRDGHRVTAPHFGLSERHILTIERLAIEPEILLGRSSIADQFESSFFKTDFWLMWCSTFAFQPWHSAVEFKRYLLRFAHLVGGFSRLNGIMRTVYNQFDSLVRPLYAWLDARGVRFEGNIRVVDIKFSESAGVRTACALSVERDGIGDDIALRPQDQVLVTLGSMTEGSSFGTMDAAPTLQGKKDGGAWPLWERLAMGHPEYGVPATFSDHIDQSKWVSFTVTLHDTTLLDLVRDATGNVPGEGGLITFPDSSWLASIVIPFQPHFIGQPEDVGVLWGYGLSVGAIGDFVKKPMSACTGREILVEIMGHLAIGAEARKILETSTCITCMMPFITSQFLPRMPGDRPQTIPEGTTNIAFIGQFCELPDDVVFTVEYSIRSAQAAAYALLGLKRSPPPVYKGALNPRVLISAFRALHDIETGAHRRSPVGSGTHKVA